MYITRYDLLTESNQKDIDNENFPDVLSLNYREVLENKNNFPTPPVKFAIPYDFCYSLWSYIYTAYNDLCLNNDKVFLDDILLDLNNIKYKTLLQENNIFYFFTKDDLESFLKAYSNG